MSEHEEPTLFEGAIKPKLSPAYPGRAPWGTSVSLRAWQTEAMKNILKPTRVTLWRWQPQALVKPLLPSPWLVNFLAAVWCVSSPW